MNTIDIVVDLETLGTAPGSVILTLAAASSNDRTFKTNIELTSSMRAGLLIDDETQRWWMSKQPSVWEAATANAVPLDRVLGDFAFWLHELRAANSDLTGNTLRLWGDAASFDLTLLACAYRAAKIILPWHYREEYCYRTLRSLLRSEKPPSKVAHDGLSDALAELAHLTTLLALLEPLLTTSPILAQKV